MDQMLLLVVFFSINCLKTFHVSWKTGVHVVKEAVFIIRQHRWQTPCQPRSPTGVCASVCARTDCLAAATVCGTTLKVTSVPPSAPYSGPGFEMRQVVICTTPTPPNASVADLPSRTIKRVYLIERLDRNETKDSYQ